MECGSTGNEHDTRVKDYVADDVDEVLVPKGAKEAEGLTSADAQNASCALNE